MTVTRLVLVRHGETVWNLQKRWQGHLDSPLTPLGLAQAQAAAAWLAGESINQVYASDLGRVIATAEQIAAPHGRPIHTDVRLRERHNGLFEGLSEDEVKAHHPEEHDVFRRMGYDGDYAIPGGGESRAQVLARGMACLEELVQRHPGEQMVVVSHGGWLSTMLRHMLGIPFGHSHGFSIANGSIHRVHFSGDRWMVDTLGEAGHLRNLNHGL